MEVGIYGVKTDTDSPWLAFYIFHIISKVSGSSLVTLKFWLYRQEPGFIRSSDKD